MSTSGRLLCNCRRNGVDAGKLATWKTDKLRRRYDEIGVDLCCSWITLLQVARKCKLKLFIIVVVRGKTRSSVKRLDDFREKVVPDRYFEIRYIAFDERNDAEDQATKTKLSPHVRKCVFYERLLALKKCFSNEVLK